MCSFALMHSVHVQKTSEATRAAIDFELEALQASDVVLLAVGSSVTHAGVRASVPAMLCVELGVL
jgi:hypothetical protein